VKDGEFERRWQSDWVKNQSAGRGGEELNN